MTSEELPEVFVTPVHFIVIMAMQKIRAKQEIDPFRKNNNNEFIIYLLVN
jgi:hypothetical protein